MVVFKQTSKLSVHMQLLSFCTWIAHLHIILTCFLRYCIVTALVDNVTVAIKDVGLRF